MNGIPDDLLPIVSVGFESTATNVNDDETVRRLLPAWEEQLGRHVDWVHCLLRIGTVTPDPAHLDIHAVGTGVSDPFSHCYLP